MANVDKRYLGDGVYVHRDGYQVVLTTTDGVRTTNTVYLEPEVVDALLAYLVSTDSSLVMPSKRRRRP